MFWLNPFEVTETAVASMMFQYRRHVTKMRDDEQQAPAALYRQTARTLRQLAAQIRFDFCRREQLLALADGFDRYVERLEAAD
jgi:hypothetical protein